MKIILGIINTITLGIVLIYIIPLADIYLGNGLGDLIIITILLVLSVIGGLSLILKKWYVLSIISGIFQIITLIYFFNDLSYWHW